MKILKRKYIIAIIIVLVVSLFFISPTLSKYRNETVRKVINLFTRYKVNYVTAGGKINNSDNFSSYLSLIGLNLPTESDIDRIGYDFNGWYEDNSYTGSAITRIPIGSEGDKTYYASWIVSRYTLKINVTYDGGAPEAGLPDGWNLVIGKDNYGNDNVITLDSNGEIVVDKGETVSLRTRYSSDASLSGWSINEDIVFTERYHAGDQYIYYDFKMPRHTVTATFGEENDNCVDIAKSPITFEENVDIGSRTQNGFWYKSTIKGMNPLKTDSNKGNFYAWDNSETFCVTSKGISTQNQLTIVGGMSVNFKNAVLAVTDDYIADAVNRKLGNTVMETKGQGAFNDTAANSWSKYGNIVISYSQNTTYTTNIHIEGENTIGSIFTSQYYKNNAYKMIVNISGSNSNSDKLYFASSWGNMNITFSNLKVEQYENNTSVQSSYPDNSEYLTWITAGSSTYGNITFTKCDVNAPNKRLFTGYGYIYFYGTDATIDSLRISYSMTISSSSSTPSNIHVLGEVYDYYYGVTLSGNSKFIVDGSFRINGYSSSGSSINNGVMVVKGNIFDAGSLTMSNGTLIANAIVIGTSSSISGNSRIITNVLTNSPNGRPVFDSTTGQYTTGFGGTTSLTLARSNNDNLPYRNYSNSSSSNSNYTFSGGNVYLFGYYEMENGLFSNTFNTQSDGNPLKEIVLEYETNGLTNITDTYLKNKMIPTNNETIILGNSANDYRTFRFSGANVYSAGNITLYNNTIVTGGKIDAKGSFSTKKDLNITGGTVIANEIGNAYNLKTTENNLSSWKNTNITGGNITTNKIGAITREINNIEPKSYVSIGTGATFSAKDNSDIDVVSDVYVNYVYSDLYTNSVNNPESIRFEGTLTGGTNKSLQNLEVTYPTLVDNKVLIIKPTLVATNELQKWKFDSLSGPEGNYVDQAGYLNGDTSTDPIYLSSQMNLYAAKENYVLTVNGENYSVTSNGENVSFVSNSANVKADSTIVLSLQDVLMTPKTVVWYYDDSGLLHNAITSPSDIDYLYGLITFKMPCADTEIHITNDLTIDLYKHHVTFTSDGFAVEYDSNRRSDSDFTYSGNLVIKQSNINRVTTVASHGMTASGYFSNPFRAYKSGNTAAEEASYKMKFESGSTTLNRTITLEKIKQGLSQNEYGIYIEDGENVELNINGYVYIYPIRLTGNSNLVINGTNNTTDAISIKALSALSYTLIGNTGGKSGNITFNNIWLIHPNSGKLANSYTKSTNKVEFNNVIYDYYAYAYGSIASGYTNVLFNNSDMLVNAGGDTANSLFSSTTDVTFNNTSFKYTSGGGRTYYILFYGMNNMYIKGTSSIIYNLRNSTTSTASLENINISNFANLVELSDDATLSVDHRLRLKKIRINDNASFTIDKLGTSQADIEKDTYLMANNIEVNGGLLEADYILVSGYYNGTAATTESGTLNYLRNNTDILNGSTYNGLVISGGTVRAHKFVGGDVNGRITITDGVLESSGIGTSGRLYGFASYLPIVGEDYVYSIDKIPLTGTVINVAGGTVNVLDNGYLGGMNGTVNISGGIINLANGAVIGVTDAQRTTLYNNATSSGSTPSNFVIVGITDGEILGNNGMISTPYSTLNISGTNTGINVGSIYAENGTINISNANSKYDCPIDNSVDVGLSIINEIAALNVNITNGARVYGGKIVTKTIDTTDTGTLLVDNTSSIYTNAYGSVGSGTGTVTINGTALGARQYSIRYIMNDNYIDPAVNPNVEYYVEGSGIVLQEPTRYGYTFVGWYLNNNVITELGVSELGDKEIEARWIPNKVKFKVTISASDVGLSSQEFASEVAGLDGILNGNTFTFNGIVEIDYRDLIIGTNNINYTNYNLNSHNILSAKINNNTLNPDNDEINVTSSSVTREIMEYYLANNNEPIEIAITSIS